MKDLSFGGAVECLKLGKAVAREGWNGKGMFIYLVPGNAYPAQTGVAKQFWGDTSMVPYSPYIAMKAVDGMVDTWSPSVRDVLAEDWEVIEIAPYSN
jgi:hypothetical protein